MTQPQLTYDAHGVPIIPEPHDKPTYRYDDVKHRYWINDVEVPSVTTVLDRTWPKDALPWWGMRVGMGAVVKLLQEHDLSWPTLAMQVYDEILTGVPVKGPSVLRGRGRYKKLKTELEALVLDAKLTTNHIRDAAADQGTMIHDAITAMGIDDEIPDISDFPVAQRPYVQAFSRWWLEQEPEFIRQEIIAGDPVYGYAGRYDLEARGHLGRGLLDFKTSKGVYPAHFEQLDLYQNAIEREPDVEPFDWTGIVHLRPDGKYAVYTNPNPDHHSALTAVHLYHARKRNELHMPKGHLDRD